MGNKQSQNPEPTATQDCEDANKYKIDYRRTPSYQTLNFEMLRDQCFEEGKLFEDHDFPATISSLYISQQSNDQIYIEWKRPTDIAENPQLCVGDFSRFDLQPGEISNSGLLTALANLTLHPYLVKHVVPEDQSFDEKYAGIFHFKFWQLGNWVDVVIDDLLPTHGGKLISLHSSKTNEFWSALLEKAYAKLHGSYEALANCTACDAMEHFTGGVTEVYQMDKAPSNLFNIMLKAYRGHSLMSCSLEPDPDDLESKTPEGLIRGQAYSISRVMYVDVATSKLVEKVPLVRARNPRENEVEWNGAWSEQSAEWQFISETEKQQLGLEYDPKSEFWMTFADFKQHFTRLDICNLASNTADEDEADGATSMQWKKTVAHGKWVRGVTAGGCNEFLETFPHNPQYCITLDTPDEDDVKCTVIVGLAKKNGLLHDDSPRIGFSIYHLTHSKYPKPLDMNFFKSNTPVAEYSNFTTNRAVNCRFKLPHGMYCIVPSTQNPNEEAEFLLRILSETPINIMVNDQTLGIGAVDERVSPLMIELPDVKEAGEMFRLVAGEDHKASWLELKHLFFYVMRGEQLAPYFTEEEAPTTSTDDNNKETANMFCFTLRNVFCCKQQKPKEKTIKMSTSFSTEACKSMMSMLEGECYAKIDFEEFKYLWRDIKKYKNVFMLYDSEDTGKLMPFTLRQAINSAGFKVNNEILNKFMQKYGSKEGTITYDNFILCMIWLRTITGKNSTPTTNTLTRTKSHDSQLVLSIN